MAAATGGQRKLAATKPDRGCNELSQTAGHGDEPYSGTYSRHCLERQQTEPSTGRQLPGAEGDSDRDLGRDRPSRSVGVDLRAFSLTDDGVPASVGLIGGGYDNALGESFVDSFKTELIADRVLRSRPQLEL